jgi:purine-cytosine permease-like protein
MEDAGRFLFLILPAFTILSLIDLFKHLKQRRRFKKMYGDRKVYDINDVPYMETLRRNVLLIMSNIIMFALYLVSEMTKQK